MKKYYIVELQLSTEGVYAHLVHEAFNEDPKLARNQAESVYHQVLAAAAISNTARHAAILFTAEGIPIMHHCYDHETGEENIAISE